MTLVASLIPPLLGGLLAWTGAGKLLSRSLPAQAARTALPRLVRGPRCATLVLRATGAAEVLLAAALLAAPAATLPGAATAALGAGFLAYLGYARAAQPESSCGCSAGDDTPVTWHSFARAGAVALGGAVAAGAAEPWWREAADRPLAAAALLAAGAAGLVYLSAGPERRWRLAFRRLRLRVAGHPLPRARREDGAVPVAASVELLERSLAFQAASPVVRSGLIEHWDEDGWRILHYTGTHREGGRERPVSVIFALDAAADLDHAQGHVVRVSVVDRETEEVVTDRALGGLLPLAAPPQSQPQPA
ncbi:MauE/DoxX family redox-associated membrane protein [Streptomyces sp. 6N223]|uniref:MauE/DoxX family redox-associated membrane protein n=1 Tax=Streptomyces sp. 6N223 TaxID=3457412 RepID=UPI003FD1F069